MKFKSRKDIVFNMVIFSVVTLLIGITILGLFKGEMEQEERWTLIPIISVIILILWIYFGTNYELNQTEFIYKSGPFNGRINIDRISEIVKGKTLYVGFKAATARKGLIVKYDKYEELYISPDSNETFIKKIIELNSTIKITD